MLQIVDRTGTQTDCEKPLSRKKLKQLMPAQSGKLTARELEAKIGRPSLQTKREARLQAHLAKLEKLETAIQGPASSDSKEEREAIAASVLAAKPSIFSRMGAMFDRLRATAERAK